MNETLELARKAKNRLHDFWCDTREREYQELAAALIATHERLEVTEKALRWYSDPANHTNCFGGWGTNDGTPVSIDRGKLAMAALEGTR